MFSTRFTRFASASYFWVLPWILFSGDAFAQTRQQKVMQDKLKFEKNRTWFYNDLEKGFESARQRNQPLLVVLRCIPCEECVKLDDDLIEANPALQKTLKSFVCVRVIATNGLDLSKFQFDTDQSFAAFVFNADGTLYCRYGTRSDRVRWEDDVSVEGLGKCLDGALALHRDYPSNKTMLLGKQADKPPYPFPEEIPLLKNRFTSKLDYEGDTVKSCIHCHMIGESIKANIRNEHGKIPESTLFSFPHPKTIGLILDPAQCASVKEIVPDSQADKCGLQVGDRISLLSGQSILSIADMQWVLHHVSADGGDIDVSFYRGDQLLTRKLTLEQGWKTKEDIAWRASTWSLRQMGLGGLSLKPATEEQRAELEIGKERMALSVQHVGAYAPHDRAKKAGFQKGDVIIEYDGRNNLLRETDLLEYAVNEVDVGRVVPVRIRRGTEEKIFELSTAKKQ